MKIRSFLAIMLAFCVCFSISVPTLALEITDNAYVEEELADFPTLEEQEGIIDLLSAFAAVSKSKINTYGTPGISVGENIKSYNYINENFVPTVSIYPIFKDDELYMLAVGGDGDNATNFGCDTTIVDSLKENLNNEKEFALVYDRLNCYLFDGTNWIILQTYSHEKINDVLDINSNIDTSVIELGSFSKKISIGSLYNQARLAYITCPVEYVPQVYNNICWAACVASIVNTLLDDNLVAVEVAQNYHYKHGRNDFNIGLGISAVRDVLEEYGVNYVYNNNPANIKRIEKNIVAGYPVYATFLGSSSHSCVIYGIAPGPGYEGLLVMDPEADSFDADYPNSKSLVRKDTTGYYILDGISRFYLDRICAAIW